MNCKRIKMIVNKMKIIDCLWNKYDTVNSLSKHWSAVTWRFTFEPLRCVINLGSKISSVKSKTKINLLWTTWMWNHWNHQDWEMKRFIRVCTRQAWFCSSSSGVKHSSAPSKSWNMKQNEWIWSAYLHHLLVLSED